MAMTSFAGLLWSCPLVACSALAGDQPPGVMREVELDQASVEYAVTSWHTENGLPDGTITTLQQTPDGYVWIGTPRGLARFDGVNFTTFDSKGSNPLADENITGLHLDRSGRLWIGCESGVLMRREQGGFRTVHAMTPMAVRGTAEPLVARSTHSRRFQKTGLADDEEGFVWFQPGRSALVRTRDGETQIITATNGLPPGEIFGLVADAKAQPWLLAGQTLYRRVGGEWVRRSGVGNLRELQPAFGPARAGGLWVALPRVTSGTGGGHVLHFDSENISEPFAETPWEPNLQRLQATAVMEDRSRRVWLGTHWGGVYFADARGHWRRPLDKGLLDQCRVTALFEDRQGSVWIGTMGDGLHRLAPRPVTTLRLPEPAKDHLVNTVCARRDGSVWVGTDGAGVFRYQNGTFTHFGTNAGLGNTPVFSLLEDSRTNLWCGTANGLMQFVDGRFEYVRKPAAPAGFVLALFEDRAGGLWIGSPKGPVSWRNDKFELHPLAPDAPLVEIRSFGQDMDGNIWVGTIAQGVYCLRSNRVERFGAAQGLLNQDARSVWCDADGGVWVGTLGGGLFQLTEGRFRALTRDDGLPDDTINSILEDNEGNLWMNSYNGYFGVSRQLLAGYERGKDPALVCRWLSLAEGLDFRICSGAGQPIASRGMDGLIWFGNQRHLAKMDPSGSWGRRFEPNVVLESLVTDGTARDGETPGEIRVPSSVRRFEFRFTALHLNRPESAHFRYRLEGFDRDWVDAGGDRVAYYGHLHPGRYAFEAMVGSPAGTWHGPVRPLEFEVVPALWERRSVQVLALTGVLGVAAVVAWRTGRARMRRRLAALEQQQVLERERARIAQDLHDDLGTSLTEISLLSAVAGRPTASVGDVQSLLRNIADKSAEMVRALDEIVWAVNPKNDSLPSLAHYVCLFAQEFLRPTPIRCRLDVPINLPAWPLNADQRHTLFLVVKEALANMAKHSAAVEAWLRISVQDHRLVLRLEDDGKGFDPASAPSERNGLRNMKSRLIRLGGICEIHSQPGAGTCVSFELPFDGTGIPRTEANPPH